MKLLAPFKAAELGSSGPGVDIRPMADAGAPALLLWFGPEWTYTEYFAFHHTNADTFDKIDPTMMLQNTQVFAIMAYLLAEIPHRLPHSLPVKGCSSAKTPPDTAATSEAPAATTKTQ
jgi:carboxypeptidase Q